MEALHDVVKAGKARYLGARDEEREVYPLLADQGVGAIPWSPLAAGLVTRPRGQASTTRGKTNPTTDASGTPLWLDSDQGIVDTVQAIAEERSIPMAQVALAWVLRHPVVTAPIVGATKPHHLADAVAALDVQLSDKDALALEEHYTPRKPSYYGSKSGY